MHSAVTCKYVNTRRIPWQNHWVKQGLNSQPQTNNHQPQTTSTQVVDALPHCNWKRYIVVGTLYNLVTKLATCLFRKTPITWPPVMVTYAVYSQSVCGQTSLPAMNTNVQSLNRLGK